MSEYELKISEDQDLVLFEFFARFEETDKLEFVHPAEYLALMNIAGQIDKIPTAIFDPKYDILLQNARRQVAEGFEGDVPGMDSKP